ncbi:MAG: BlaI/MecI/CopY family transcriptional regulator [Acidobacteriota bacterium]
MTRRNINKRPLTDLQQAILDIVWSKGSVTADQVREALQPSRRLKDSTVRTLLRRLEARGLLNHRVDGRMFVYRASVHRRRLAARTVRQIIDRFWAGSTEQFLLGMVDEKVVSLAELERLTRRVTKA